jgi:hypothetical protein
MRPIERRVRALEKRVEALDEERADEKCAALLRTLSDAELAQLEALGTRLEAGESLESQCASDRQLVERLDTMWEAMD